MRDSLRRLIMLAICVLFASSVAYAQATASLSGLVVDTGGGVIPGATVVVKNNATGLTQTLVSNGSGAFAVPALPAGVYTVTVSLNSFKTVIISEVRLLAATAAEVKATLEVGSLTESVSVKAGSELVQTQSTAVQSTLKAEQLKEIPLVSRNALYAVAFLPGVETTNSAGPRASTISGLPQNAINITIDGVSTGNQLQSGDGFFSMVTPRLDAVEEITVTNAVSGAAGAQGSIQIAFVTRAGTTRYESSIYHYMRRPSFNSNYYYNKIRGLPRNETVVDNYGGRIGGPIKIPGLLDNPGKAFFFFNFEHFHQPNSASRNRTILNPQAQAGVFTYLVGTTSSQVDLFALAARNGQTATPDPTVMSLLTAIRAATGLSGVVTTPPTATNTQAYAYLSAAAGNQYAPTTRIDFNFSQRHRLTGTYYWQRFKSSPDLLNNVDPQFPGFPNKASQNSYRTTGSLAMRSTLSATMVNELKGGWQWSPNEFFTDAVRSQFENQGFWNMTLGFGLSGATATASPAPRNTTNIGFDDTLSYLRGQHSFSIGGGFTRIINRSTASTLVPGVTFSVNTANDPANAMFTNGATGNFVGASAPDLTNARNLYALLTGRIATITGTSRLDASTGKYVYNGDLQQALQGDSFYGFLQDSWKLRPNLTVNAGLRYEVFLPVKPITATYSVSNLATICGISGVGNGVGGRGCNLFKPGTLSGAGVAGIYEPFVDGNGGYKTNWNNVGPNFGVAWQPNVQSGVFRKLLGDPETATIRAGYAWTFNVEKMDRFTGIYGGNPGGTTSATRQVGSGNLVLPGESWPLLLRETNRTGPPATCAGTAIVNGCVPGAPSYPIGVSTANSVNIFDANLQTPHVESWSVGLQRSLGKDTAVELRYIGNRNLNAWQTDNYNERVLVENGFVDEFARAMANLQSHVAAGCGTGTVGACSFAYRGAGTGTQPLPIYMGYFLGRSGADVSNPAMYTGTNWTNTSYTADLSPHLTNASSTANDLHGDTTFRANAIAAGLAANFFQLNPNIGNANVTRSEGGNKYKSIQAELRRRLSRGLTLGASYTWAIQMNSTSATIRFPRFFLQKTDGVPHSLKMNWTYEIPVGRDRRFGSGINPILNGFIGGWEFSGTGRVQRQTYNAGSVRLVNMTKSEAQKEFRIRIVKDATSGLVTVYSMPQDIIDNTRKAYNVDPTSPTGYGSLGVPTGRYFEPNDTPGCIALYDGDCNTPKALLLYGPAFVRFDMRIKKLFHLGAKATAQIDFEVMNVFNNINFNHALNPGSAATIFQVTSAYSEINTTQDPGGRLGQIIWRVTF